VAYQAFVREVHQDRKGAWAMGRPGSPGGRYVQSGDCTTVGVAGLTQGGGFGSFSKGLGSAAANLLEAKIVTADGPCASSTRSRTRTCSGR
jgi:hypothetical protein